MAEQQLTQEQLGQEQAFDALPPTGPGPKQTAIPAPAFIPNQSMFAATEKIRPAAPKKEEKVIYKEKQEKLPYLGDLSVAENAFRSYATLDKAEKIGTETQPGSMIGMISNIAISDADRAAYASNVKRDKAQALIVKNETIKKLTDSGVQQKLSDSLFGSFNDIVKQGGKVSKYLTKNQAGVDVIDEGKLRSDFDKIVGAKGNNGGSYIKEFLWSQVASDASLDNIIAVYNKRDKITAAMPTGVTKEQQQRFMLEAKSKTESKIKSQVKVQDKLLQDKVAGIKEKYSGQIASIQQDVNYYIDAAQQKVAKQLEGITGIYGPALQESYNRRVKEVFDAEYAQYVMPAFDKISNEMAAEIKTAVSAVNSTVKRIYKEANVALGEEFNKWQKEQNKAQAELFTKNVGSIIEEGIKERGGANKAYAESMINMSNTPGALGIATTGKIFGEAFVSGYGSLKNKTALLFNALGYEADFLDEMRYSGKSLENRYSMEKLPLGENWFKPGYWAQSIAQSGPTMAAGMLVTALTRNPYLGGIVSFATESVENSGGVMERVLENTGDLNAATQAASEAFIKNTPTVIADVLFQRMFAPLSSLKALKQPATARASQLLTGIVAEGATETWQTAVELSTGVDAKLGLGQALVSKEAVNAGIEGGITAGILGGAGISFSGAYNALFNNKNIPSARTQAIASTILTNGETAAMAGTQIDALANDIDDATLGEGMKEVADISKTINDARQIGLNPQQTQVFTSLSKELADLNASLSSVTDPSVRKALQTQVAAKEKEIEGIVSGQTPIATIELQPGLAFTGTVDGVRNVMNVPEVKAEVEAGNVKIITEDPGLNAEVEQARTAPTRQRNIISDTGEIIGQVPAEAAPVAEAAPAAAQEAEGEVFVTGTANGLETLIGKKPEGFVDRRNTYEQGKGQDVYFTEDTVGGKKIFSIVDRTATDNVGRPGFISTSISVDENSTTTINDVKQKLTDLHQQTLTGVDRVSGKIDKERLSTIQFQKPKTQQDATKISERAQQEIPQPGDIVQREGTQEGQPQVGQAEGPVGQTTQPAADTRNRDFGSQEEQIAATAKALEVVDSKELPLIRDTASNIMKEYEQGQKKIDELNEEKSNLTEKKKEDIIKKSGYKKSDKFPDKYEFNTGASIIRKSKEKIIDDYYQNKIKKIKKDAPNERVLEMYRNQDRQSSTPQAISEAYVKAKADGSNPELVKAVEDLIGQPAAQMAETAPVTEAPMQVDELLDLDLKQPGNLEKAFNWLDNADKSLGKQIGSGKFYDIAGAAAAGGLITARAIVQALRAAVGGAITLRDAIAKVAKDFNITDKDVTDAINKVAEVENAERLYSKPEIRGVITIANEEATNLKTTEKSSLVAYQKVFATVQKAIQKIYDSGLIPEGASPQVMIQVTKGIARDAVNAAYPKREVAPKVTMSVRTYIADLLRQQSIAGKKISESSKEVRKVVSDIFKSMNKRFGTTIKYTDADFRKIMKEIEDAIFRKPITKENTDELVDNVNSIVEQAYTRGFEKDVRPKIAELVDRLMTSEMKRFGNIDEAAYSAFGKAVEYINNNQKEFKIKDIQPDDVLAQEIDKKLNKLKKKEKVAEADAQVMSMFATPQVRSLVDAAQQTADDIVKVNKGKKIGKTSPTQAYKNILSDLIKKINAMYARGNYPAGIPSVTLVKAASGIAQDAVNAAFPRAEKLSIQEAEMSSMSTREYIRNMVSNQMNAIGEVKNRAKAIQAAVERVINTFKENFGTDFSLSSSLIKQLNKDLFSAVFSKMDDTTAIGKIIEGVVPVVEYAMKRQMLSNTAKLLDKLRSNYKLGRYSGAARLSIMENFLNADARKWLKSAATLEDISMFNQYLKELTGKNIDTTNIDAAVELSNQFVPSPQQSTIAEKDSLNNKIKSLIKKAAAGQLDFGDYGTLVSLEKSINDINERKGALTGLSQQEQDDIIQNYNDLISSLPKPIDQLLADAQAQIDADVKDKVGALGTAIETSQEFRDSIENPLLYEAVLRFRNEMTDDFINSLTPKEKMLLSANIDEILRGNPNSVTYDFSAKAGAFKQSNINYKFGKDIFSKRQLINNNGVTGFFGKVRRLFMDVDYNRASAERMAASFDLFRFHLMDAELNTGVDEFGMGVLERDVFAPIARAIDSAFNKVTESLSPLQEALKLLNDKSNRAAIKKGIGQMNKELGTGFFGGKTKWMHMKNLLGYGNTFYMEVSTRMATIVATQIDHISNLEEGESATDVVLLRNILGQKAEDYDGRTMKEHYQTNPSAITDMTDEASLFDHIAYGILTKGGVNKLSDLSKEDLLNLLTDSQKQAIAKWREHIDNTKYVVEAAMIMKGGVTAFLNEYFPRRVYSKDGVGEIKDIEEYLSQAGANVGVDSGQLKSRKGEVGRLDLNGNSVLYNNLKDIYLIHEVKPVLDSLKGLDVAVDRLKKERDLGSATYAEAISIAVASRVKNALQSNERIANNNYTFTFRLFSKVSSVASRVILISQLRQVFADFFSNITKLSAALGFANRSMKNQIMQVVNPKMSSYTTDKGTFKWDDYVKVALATGSSVHRIMSVYADNFLYEFSKPKEQLQREQRVASWQDMAVKKHAWMSRFEEAFNRIAGEYLDHEAFADERGAYRAIYSDAVQRASDAADSFIDRQYGLASIARQPVRIQVVLPFIGRATRNLFGKSPTIARDNPASVVLGFLSGYPSVQFQLFSRYMRSALSMDRDISAKQRAEDISRALTEVIVPSIVYNVTRAATATIFTTTAAAVMAAGDDEEDRKKLYKEMENMPFWKRLFTKTRIAIGESEQKFVNAVINGMLSSTIDPNVNAIVRPVAGLFLFKAWKENVIEDMTKRGKTRSEIQEAKQKIKEYEDVLFETYSIRPIEIFGTKEYQEGIKRYYSAGAQSEGLEDLIKSTGGFGILYNEVSRSMDLAKLIDATDENKNLSESELFAASALKLGGLTFANVILGGKLGATLSMFSGDMNKVANMIISDQKSIQTGFEISKNKKPKKGAGKKTRGGSEARGGGGARGGARRGVGGGAR